MIGLLMAGCRPTVDIHQALEEVELLPKETPNQTSASLQQKVAEALIAGLHERELSVEENAAWQIFHGVLAYRGQLPLKQSDHQVNAIAYALQGGEIQGWELAVGDVIPKTGRKGVRARVEPGSYIGQGHVDQWLAIFAQIDLPKDQLVQVGNQTLTIEDWARMSQYEVSENPYSEFSWSLMALMHYFPDDVRWQCKDGNEWTYEPMVEYEAKQDLGTSPCGGMHRMMGLAHAVRFRKRHQEPLNDAWKLASDKIDEVIQVARRYQNRDGSFSSNYTVRPGRSLDLAVAISTTGHTLEFLAFALPVEELASPWVERAVERLCVMLQATKMVDLECGGLYHALNGLRIYYQRRFGDVDFLTGPNA